MQFIEPEFWAVYLDSNGRISRGNPWRLIKGEEQAATLAKVHPNSSTVIVFAASRLEVTLTHDYS